MQKDFNGWNKKKKKMHNREDTPFFHTREIWWCSLGVNIGFEQDGTGENFYRPVLILKGMSKETCFVIPLTTSDKRHKFRPSIGIVDGKEAKALLSQMRLIDAKRLIRKMEYLDEKIFERIRKTIKEML
ncbi:MAG: type II toxin-antitoxin system PemK/MazF family toxin [Patescibacteria group bacterium]|nr:type II toxin-antitoxin system PemK/MazF family toxin [Patescibacteria group bacterium]